ncbi:GMC oxidoreductase [Sphaerobolus stellatus SS14]|uniref:Unplaced genomic scaffold SPHSTscaffold_101, whole genome shotgun sequence n=1 Tax=Sphaerobolus stellatus (strain SS14) TaxID=990650 RepID=A0A0C9VGZ2_SPHS4|nr:GMC oxidoreductase [Sphaerobolus stellatus SS14]
MPIVDTAEFLSYQFDYLIIGGGTAGLTLAARLSEDENVVVGVIEAGGHVVGVPEIDIPGMMGRTITNPKYDWTFFSVPQPNANGRVVLQPRGKGLGGSSLINFLGLLRPTKDEFDALEELGNPGWNWKSMLHYLKKSESISPIPLSEEDAKKFAVAPVVSAHGTNGPIVKSLPTVYSGIQSCLFDAAEALGIPRNPETSNGNPVGAMTSFISVDPETATRSHAGSGYFEPNASRKNLVVLTDAQVLKIILTPGENGLQSANDVVFTVDGSVTTLKNIKGEVILSTGTFQTPQLLELSGIGNRKILEKHGIEALIDLPGVGENLQDHACVPTIVEIDEEYETMEVLLDPTGIHKHEELYKQKQGFFSTVPAPGFIFLPVTAIGSNEEVKSWQSQAQTHISKGMESVLGELKQGLEKQYEIQRRWFGDSNHAQAEVLYYMGHQPIPQPRPVAGKRYASLIAALMHPLSRGSVHIKSSDPLSPPAIDPNYFGNQTDLDLLFHILEFTLKLYSTLPLANKVKSQILPTPDILRSDPEMREASLKEFIKDNVGPVFHPVGTASMLPRSDGGVVDHQLKVYGTANLRVELSCHTQSVAYAVGEKVREGLTLSEIRLPTFSRQTLPHKLISINL